MLDIESVLYPFTLISFILGSGIFRYPSKPVLKLRLSIFYMLTVWSVYACAFYHVIMFFTPGPLSKGFLKFFMIVISLFVTMISIIITIREYKTLPMCIKKLSVVNDTLEELGTPKEYHKMQKSVKWALIMWFTIICITYTTDSILCIEAYKDRRAFVIPLVMDYSIHINTYMDIIFAFLLRYIGTRLDKINDHIEKLSEVEKCELRYSCKKSFIITRHCAQKTENYKRVWAAMHLYSELCRIARDINSLFQIQMTLQMASYFVCLIGMFHIQYDTLSCLTYVHESKIPILSIDIWLTIFITKLVLLNHICERVSAKAQKTKCVIHKLTNLIHFAEAREDICQFVLQISLRPLRFNGMGLFYFGYSFIRTFFAWIITAIVFILQMDTSPISRMLKSANSNASCYDL